MRNGVEDDVEIVKFWSIVGVKFYIFLVSISVRVFEILVIGYIIKDLKVWGC